MRIYLGLPVSDGSCWGASAHDKQLLSYWYCPLGWRAIVERWFKLGKRKT